MSVASRLAVIESLDHEGRGVSRVEGKAVFIEGALPGEEVEYRVLRERPRYTQGETVRVQRAVAQRVAPACRHYGVCGGCSMQHLDGSAQLAAKQRVLEDALWHIGRLRADLLLQPIDGAHWHYRQRARLSVRLVPSKGGVLIGFHQKRSSHIADLDACPVLAESVAALLPMLHQLVAQLSLADRLPQIEVAVSEQRVVLVLRHLQPFTAADEQLLATFAATHAVELWAQSAGPDSARPLFGKPLQPLSYHLPEFDLELQYLPTDFTQVNVALNRVLVRRALQLLAPQRGERIVDLFCGMGNFTLPIARSGAEVIGIEGSEALVRRAEDNARHNGLQQHCTFHALNLFDTTEDSLAALGPLDKLLLDPPREGAIAVVKAISAAQAPARIVYVSCNPATLARDAAVLVHEKGYRLCAAGVANLFPHTSHVESVALFER